MYQYNTYHFSCNIFTPYTVFASHELYKDKGKKVTNLSSLKFVLAGFGVLKEAHACVSKVTKYVNVDISIGTCRWFLACVHLNLVHQYCNPNRSYSDYLACNLHLKISKEKMLMLLHHIYLPAFSSIIIYLLYKLCKKVMPRYLNCFWGSFWIMP